MRKKNQWLIKFLCVFILLSLSSCTYNSATGKNQFNWITDEKEVKLGRSADVQIKQQHGIYRNSKLSQYVNSIGQKVAAHCGRTEIDYHFTVLDSPMINAFALPGGYIYVTRGVLAQMNSEAELAFVLGHEVGHVAAKHGAQRMSQTQSIGAALSLASILLKEDYNQWGQLVNKVAELSVLGYGRENEFESDILGTEYAHKANYSIKAGSKFLSTLKKQEKYQATWLEQMHSSHPPTNERIDRVLEKADKLDQPEETPLIVNKNQFLSQIEEIFMGEQLQSGQRKGNLYKNYHYGFELTIPIEWHMIATLEDPVVLMKYKNMATGSILVNRLTNTNKHHQPSNNIKRNGGYTYATYTRYTNLFKITLTFELKTPYKIENFKIPEIANSFLKLSDEDLKKSKAYRLTIHTTKNDETLSSISKVYFNDITQANEIAAFNNLNVNTKLKPKTKIKIPIY